MEISIVIPCYNHGHFIQDALDSVANLQNVEYEVIIVDDGSSDGYTQQKLDELRDEGYKVLSHPNKGLAFTRNRGIGNSVGKYILPLDADNKIAPDYVYKALEILRADEADIVYADPIFFGDNNESRHFKTKEFNGFDLFINNYLDACAIYKKVVWETVDGYDGLMPVQGHEDWEFWLNASIKGFKFRYINEGLYYYRIVNGSMIESTVNRDVYMRNHEYIIKKHASAFILFLHELKYSNDIYSKDRNNPFRSSLKYFYLFIKKLIKSAVNRN